MTFAHEVGHNLGATHDVDKYGKEVSGPLMGATLGKNITISNLKISKKSKKDINEFLANVEKGIWFDLLQKEKKLPALEIHTWPQQEQERFNKNETLMNYINCFKTKLDYSNDEKHFLKIRNNLENQVNPKISSNELTTGLTSIDSGSINSNVPNVKYLFLLSQLFQIFCCIFMLNF